MGLDEKLFNLLKETANRFFKLQKEAAEKLGLKKNYYKILVKLGIERKPLNQTNLGEICGIDKPAMSRLICSMEEEGLILKGTKEGNKKEILISATPKGLALITKISETFESLKHKYFRDLSDDEKELLIKLFENGLLKEEENA